MEEKEMVPTWLILDRAWRREAGGGRGGGGGQPSNPVWPLLLNRQDRHKVTGNTSDSFGVNEGTRHK